MKTIVVAHNYTESSFAAMSYHLAHHLSNLGHKVIFISHKPHFINKQLIEKVSGGKVIIYSWPTKKRPTSLKDILWFSKLYLKYKPNYVIGHFVGSNITIGISKILSFGKTKTIENYHTLSTQIFCDDKKISIKEWFYAFRKKLFYKIFCDVIICASIMGKRDLESFYSIKKGIIIFYPMHDRFIEKVNISLDRVMISYLGRLDPSKGVLDLVKAYKSHIEKNPESKIILNIAGSGSQKSKILEMIKNHPTIYYFGSLAYSEIDEYLNKSHFTIIPSKFDAFNVVGLESMMNQTPLLISNTTGLSDYLIEGKECFKFDPDISSLIKIFEKVENKLSLYIEMSLNARNTFKGEFSMTKYFEKFEQLIQ